MRKLLVGFVFLMSLPSFSATGNLEFLKRRNLFSYAESPQEADLNIGYYMNCISYDFKGSKRRVSVAGTRFSKLEDSKYINKGIGTSVFDDVNYYMVANQLSGIIADGEDSHMKNYRVLKDGVLIFEIATTRKNNSSVKRLKSKVDENYEVVYYGACEKKYDLDIGNIDQYEIIKSDQ